MLLCLTAIAMSGSHSLYAQSSKSDFMSDDKSLFEEVTGIKKKTDKFNLYLNMHGDFNMKWNESGFDQGAFEMKQLRIEMKGNINDWLSYRYRQRLNRGNDGSGNIDNVGCRSRSSDAGAGRCRGRPEIRFGLDFRRDRATEPRTGAVSIPDS